MCLLSTVFNRLTASSCQAKFTLKIATFQNYRNLAGFVSLFGNFSAFTRELTCSKPDHRSF